MLNTNCVPCANFTNICTVRTHFFFLWFCDPTRIMAPSFFRFLDHTQRHTTVGSTPLDEWSARRRDLYLTTHNIHNRQTSMPPGGIRTHDFSRRVAADLRLRPRGQWDRQQSNIWVIILSLLYKIKAVTHQAGTERRHRYSSTHTRPRCWKGVGSRQQALIALPPRKRPGTHYLLQRPKLN